MRWHGADWSNVGARHPYGRRCLLPPLDYPEISSDVNTWFENNDDWTGGVMPIDLDITTVVNNNE